MNHSQLRIAQTCYEDITYLSHERCNKAAIKVAKTNLILSSEKWFITENKPQTTLLESKKKKKCARLFPTHTDMREARNQHGDYQLRGAVHPAVCGDPRITETVKKTLAGTRDFLK